MRWLLLIAVLLAGPMWGQEATTTAMKEKLRARIREALPATLPATNATVRSDQEAPMLVLEPMVVTESRAVRELTQQLAEQKQRQEAEAFSLLKGGKIYRTERLDLGIWWNPEDQAWNLLKLKW